LGDAAIRSYDFDTSRSFPRMGRLPYNKIMCICAELEPILELHEQTLDLPLEWIFSQANILEFTLPGVNKGSGLKTLLESMGLQGLPLYAAGDAGQ